MFTKQQSSRYCRAGWKLLQELEFFIFIYCDDMIQDHILLTLTLLRLLVLTGDQGQVLHLVPKGSKYWSVEPVLKSYTCNLTL